MERGWPDGPPSSAYERRRKPSDRSIDRVTQDIKETQSLTGDAWIRHCSLVNVDNSPSENKRKNPLPTWLCKNKRGVTGYLCLAFGRSPRILFGSIRAYSCGQYVRKLRWTDPFWGAFRSSCGACVRAWMTSIISVIKGMQQKTECFRARSARAGLGLRGVGMWTKYEEVVAIVVVVVAAV